MYVEASNALQYICKKYHKKIIPSGHNYSNLNKREGKCVNAICNNNTNA